MNRTKSFLLCSLSAAVFAIPGFLCASTVDWDLNTPKDAQSVGITIDGENGSMGKVPIRPISKECTSKSFWIEQTGKEELRAFRWGGWIGNLKRDEWTVVTLKFQARCKKPAKIIFELRPEWHQQHQPDNEPFKNVDICFFDVACVASPDVKIKNGDFAKKKFDVWNIKPKDWTEQEQEFKAKQLQDKEPKIQGKSDDVKKADESDAAAGKNAKTAKSTKGARNSKGAKGAKGNAGNGFFFLRTCRNISQEIDVKPNQEITLTFMVRGGDWFPAKR